MIALATKAFYMPKGAVTSKQGKPLKDRQFVVIGAQFDVWSDTILVDRSNGRRYGIADCAGNFMTLAETPKCRWCALGYPRGGEAHRAGSNEHAIGIGSAVVFIERCTDPVTA
jgi:hypothetical protein